MNTLRTFYLVLAVVVGIQCDLCGNRNAVQYGRTYDGYCAYDWSIGLSAPRGIVRAPTGELLVLESSKHQVTCLWDDNQNNINEQSERAVIASASELNHGLTINGDYLYASSPTTVYRWSLAGKSIRSDLGSPTVIVKNMPDEGHDTRTLMFDPNGKLYVTVGSGSNVDSDPSRANIKTFTGLNYIIPTGGYDWNTATLFASGMRNEVGLRMDNQGGIWGVENGVDNLRRNDYGDIHEDNPTEELNYFGNFETQEDGLFYGYPYCVSVYSVPGLERLTQIAHQNFIQTYSDAWCQNTNNVVVPAFGLPAHTAPLDIIFYNGDSLPQVASGDAFVTLHGSWNRNTPQGYRVIHVKFTAGKPTSFAPFFASNLTSETGNFWQYRPVSLAFGPCLNLTNCVFVSSDRDGKIVAIAPTPAEPGFNPNDGPSQASSASVIFASIVLALLALFSAW